MTRLREFFPEVTKQLGHYVYLYVDPIESEVFYVGEGSGNPACSHLDADPESTKGRRIRKIREAGNEPVVENHQEALIEWLEALRVAHSSG